MAKEDNWLGWILGAIVVGAIAFFSLGKTVNIQAGQAVQKSGCGCSGG